MIKKTTNVFYFAALLYSYNLISASNVSTPGAMSAPLILSTIPVEGLPENITVAHDYVANENVLNCFHYLLDLSGSMKKPDKKAYEDKKLFFNKIRAALNNLLIALSAPGFTAYLEARDKGRKNAQNPQDLASNFANAYTTNQSDADLVRTYVQELIVAFTTTFNYEMLVATLGENSEITLRKRLVPCINILMKLLE